MNDDHDNSHRFAGLTAAVRASLALALGAALALACGKPPPPKTITFGAVVPLTGINAQASWADAVNLAVTDMNAALNKAKKGVQFKVVVNDTTSVGSVALQRAQDLVKTEGAKIIVAANSEDDVPMNKTFYDADDTNDLNVPILCAACSSGSINNPAKTDPDPVLQATYRNAKGWNFRTIMPTKLLAYVLVGNLLARGTNGDVNGDGQFKLTIYNDDSSFGKSTAADYATYAAQLHPTPPAIVETVTFSQNVDVNAYGWAGDMAKLTDDLNASKGNVQDGFPDAIATSALAGFYVPIVKAYKAAGSTIAMRHPHTFRVNSVLVGLGSVAEAQEGFSHVVLDNGASGDVFSSELQQAPYNEVPTYRDSMFYDAAAVAMLAALLAAKPLADPSAVAPDDIRLAIPKTSDAANGQVVRTGPDEFGKAIAAIEAGTAINFEGASGPCDFDANGNVLQRLAHYKVQASQFVDLEKYDCVKGSTCPQMP